MAVKLPEWALFYPAQVSRAYQRSRQHSSRPTSDPGQHGLKDLCARPAHNLPDQVLLLLLCEVLRKQWPHLHSAPLRLELAIIPETQS